MRSEALRVRAVSDYDVTSGRKGASSRYTQFTGSAGCFTRRAEFQLGRYFFKTSISGLVLGQTCISITRHATSVIIYFVQNLEFWSGTCITISITRHATSIYDDLFFQNIEWYLYYMTCYFCEDTFVKTSNYGLVGLPVAVGLV